MSSQYFFTKIDQQFDKILVRGYRDGKPFKRKVDFKPTLYIPSKTEHATLRSFHNVPLAPKQFSSIKDAREFMKLYQDVDNFRIFGMQNWINNFIHEEFPGEINYDDTLIRIGYLDIETDSEGGYPKVEEADKEITAITLVVKDRTFVWGMKDFKAPKDVDFFWFESEVEMLKHFLKVWIKLELDAVSGWNTMSFDLPYMVRRIARILSFEYAKKLSPWGIIKPRMIKSYRGQEIEIFDIFGIIDLDYLPAFKKFRPPSLNPDDNKLDTVAYVVLDEKKLDYSEYGSLNRLYRDNPQKFFEYNVKDARLVQRMEERLNILRLIFNMAYSAKINMHECFMPTKLWDSIIYGYLKERNIVVPIDKREDADTDSAYEGAYVKHPVPAFYKWVVSFDLTSLYPSLFMHYNIGPDTFRGRHEIECNLLEGKPHGFEQYLKDNNLSMAANGVVYTREFASFMTEIIQYYFDRRQHYKTLMKDVKTKSEKSKNKEEKEKFDALAQIYDIYQQNYKISLNALYGANGNKGFRFYDLNHAEAITISGQLTIKWAEKHLNAYINTVMGTTDVDYCIGVDTDSLYMNFEPLIKKFNVPEDKIVDFLDRFAAEKVQPQLDKFFRNLTEYMNAYQQKLYMKREKISDKVVWVAKKRYFQRALDNEGVRYTTPKIEITGLEAVRTTVPEFCRKKLKEAYEIVLNKTEEDMQAFIPKVREEFLKLPFADISTPKGCKGLTKYGDRNFIYTRQMAVPIQVRGSLLYNYLLKQQGLNEYEPILEGEKVRYCYLKMPNPIHENVICAPRILPREFDLYDYIDYDTQFSKSFLEPLKTILDIVGWREEKIDTLAGFFE